MNVIVHHSENIISCILIHSNVKHEIPPSLFFVKYVRYSREHFQVNYSIIWKDESKMNLYIFHSRNWKIIMLYFAKHLKSKKNSPWEIIYMYYPLIFYYSKNVIHSLHFVKLREKLYENKNVYVHINFFNIYTFILTYKTLIVIRRKKNRLLTSF